MNLIRLTRVGAVAAAAAVVWGCGSADRDMRRSTAVGAASGAVIGGIIGAEAGEAGAGAAAGAVVGGAAGAAYEGYRDRHPDDVSVPDARNFDDADYMALLTAQEEDILKARRDASNRDRRELAEYLTRQEKENLRRRAAQRGDVEIGS